MLSGDNYAANQQIEQTTGALVLTIESLQRLDKQMRDQCIADARGIQARIKAALIADQPLMVPEYLDGAES